ncbi:MAG: Mur ligase family protein [Patescibacteria group bacterium]
MKLRNFLYLTQLEEYDIARIQNWLLLHPNTEVQEIKKHLVWTLKIKVLYLISHLLFFLPPEKSIISGLKILKPIDNLLKDLIIFITKIKLKLFHRRLIVIGVTGSWGKTTVKETLVTILKTKYRAHGTIDNQNTPLGICLRLLKLPLNSEIFVAEIGAYKIGDINKVCQIINPKYGIITAIGPMHLERFGGLENIFQTKMELAQSIPAGGWLFLPKEIKTKVSSLKLPVKIIDYFDQIEKTYSLIANRFFCTVPQNLPSPPHRLQITQNGPITIIDDSYNSNPAGFHLALEHLKKITSKNKIMVTPGMIELGSLQDELNSKLAKESATVCQHLVIVGITNRHSLLKGAKSAKSKTKIHTIDSFAQAQNLLPTISSTDSAILFENDLPDNYF